ncbi:MAG: hypothetical protein IKM41_07575 [Tidjanibacter sp.]|nr:hypothetical protein [Tidjanibacter sp.]
MNKNAFVLSSNDEDGGAFVHIRGGLLAPLLHREGANLLGGEVMSTATVSLVPPDNTESISENNFSFL